MPTILLDKERPFSFDLNAMIKFRQLTGKDISVLSEKDSFNVEVFRALLYSCLATDNPDLTLESTGKPVTIKDMDRIATELLKAINAESENPLAGPGPSCDSTPA